VAPRGARRREGGALGSLLETFDVPNTVPSGTGAGGLVTFSSVVAPVLAVDETYWLAFSEPGAPDGAVSFWFFNDELLAGPRITESVSTLPAFEVQASEPSLLAVLALAAGVERRRLRAPSGR